MLPLDRLSPGGSELPADNDTVYGPVPPLTGTDWEYVDPYMPSGIVDPIRGGGGTQLAASASPKSVMLPSSVGPYRTDGVPLSPAIRTHIAGLPVCAWTTPISPLA